MSQGDQRQDLRVRRSLGDEETMCDVVVLNTPKVASAAKRTPLTVTHTSHVTCLCLSPPF